MKRKFKTAIVIDVDNVSSTMLMQIKRLVKKDTFVLAVGRSNIIKFNGEINRAASPNWKKYVDLSNGLSGKQLMIVKVPGKDNAADMMIAQKIGQLIPSWKECGVENLIVSSNDFSVFQLCITYKWMFNLWTTMDKHSKSMKDARSMGIVVPTITFKGL